MANIPIKPHAQSHFLFRSLLGATQRRLCITRMSDTSESEDRCQASAFKKPLSLEFRRKKILPAGDPIVSSYGGPALHMHSALVPQIP